MPALTHGRVKNGFNLLPRTITYAQGNCDNDAASANQNMAEPTKWQNEAKLCPGSQRALCCGRPLQYTNMGGMRLYRNARIPTGPANRKFASTVSVGRSFAAKRAIARRTASCHPEHGTGGWTATFKIYFTSWKESSNPYERQDWVDSANVVYKILGANPLLAVFAGVVTLDQLPTNILVAPVDSYIITKRELVWPRVPDDGKLRGSRPSAIYSIKANFKKLYSAPPALFNVKAEPVPLESLTGNPPNGKEAWYLLSQVNYKITGMALTISGNPFTGQPGTGVGQGGTKDPKDDGLEGFPPH